MHSKSRFTLAATLSGALLFLASDPAGAQVSLGSAHNFSVIGYSTITNVGLTVVNGNLGLTPGSSITGFPPGTVTNGTMNINNAAAVQANANSNNAFTSINALPCSVTYGAGTDISTLSPIDAATTPVICFTSSAIVTGPVVISGAYGNPVAFKVGSSLTVANNVVTTLAGGITCDQVQWAVGSSANIGANSAFVGDILAMAGVTLHSGASTTGRAFSLNGAVSLDTNSVNPCFNAVPTASALAINGTAQQGQLLTGSYVYGDGENDPQDTSITGSAYRFVRSTDNSVATTGDNTDAATGTTGGVNRTYSLQAADVGSYLFYCVTPKASAGSSPGLEACSPATALVTGLAVNGVCGSAQGTTSSFAPNANLCTTGGPSAVTLATGTYNWSCSGSNGGTTPMCVSNWANTATGSGLAGSMVSGSTWAFAPAGNGPLQSAGFIPVSGHPKSPPSVPPGVSFPHGLFDFVLVSGAAGSTATITITYPQVLPAGVVYWKYGPTPAGYNCSGAGCAAAHWYQFPAAVIAGNTVTLTIVDGGVGDDDLAVNGVIVDQGGPGISSAASAIPSLSVWGLMMLAGLTGLLGIGGLRRRIT